LFGVFEVAGVLVSEGELEGVVDGELGHFAGYRREELRLASHRRDRRPVGPALHERFDGGQMRWAGVEPTTFGFGGSFSIPPKSS
jgi:hypothetical protein